MLPPGDDNSDDLKVAEDIVAEIKAGLKELERVKKNEEAAHDDSDADSDDSISQQKGDMNIKYT